MRKSFTLFAFITLIALLFAAPAMSCVTCYSQGSTSGNFSRDTQAGIDVGKFEDVWVNVGTKNKPVWEKQSFLVNGAMAYGNESSSGSYKAQYRGCYRVAAGFTGGIGGTTTGVRDSGNAFLAYGITGNVQVAGVLRRGTAKIKGSGNMFTVALRDGKHGYAAASTTGAYKYSGNVTNGTIAGGGVTGGFSAAQLTFNSATAVSGGFTASGIGAVPSFTRNN